MNIFYFEYAKQPGTKSASTRFYIVFVLEHMIAVALVYVNTLKSPFLLVDYSNIVDNPTIEIEDFFWNSLIAGLGRTDYPQNMESCMTWNRDSRDVNIIYWYEKSLIHSGEPVRACRLMTEVVREAVGDSKTCLLCQKLAAAHCSETR